VNQVILVSGPAGAGKSAVAEAICARFDRMLHVEVDVLRHFVKAGYRHPWMDDEQAREQLDLAIRNASAIAREAIATRYAVVIDDVVFAAHAERYRQALEGMGAPVHMVTLLPRLDVLLERDAARRYSIPDRVRALYEGLRREADAGALPGAVLDTSDDMNAEATADRVQEVVSLGEALLVPTG
jgi:adenylate kinase family enzyme